MRFKESEEAEGLVFENDTKRLNVIFKGTDEPVEPVGEFLKRKTKQIFKYLDDKKSFGIDLERACRNLFLEDCALWEKVVDWESITLADFEWFKRIKENFSIMLTAIDISEKVKKGYVCLVLENIEKVLLNETTS